MKKNIILAVLLSMITVVSTTGCTADKPDKDDETSKPSVSDKDSGEKNDKVSPFSALYGDDKTDDTDKTDTTDDEEDISENIDIPEEDESDKPREDNDSNLVSSNCLYDENNLKIEFVDKVEEYGYLDFNMNITNSGKVDLEVQAWETYINGIEVDAIMSASVKAGETITDDMGFEVEELEEKGIDPNNIESVEVSFHIFSWEDEIESIDTELIKFKLDGSVSSSTGSSSNTTSSSSKTDKSKEAKDGKLYSDKGVDITYVNTTDDYGYLDFNLKIKNSNTVDVEVQAWETYINGIEVDAIMSASVEDGKTITDSMGFDLEELEEKGIDPDKIESVEVSFHIFSWDDEIETVDTELIKFKP